MTTICWGKLLNGLPARIEVTPAEAAEFHAAMTYQARALLLRGAAFRARLVEMILTADGHLVTNLNAREPGPGETIVWLLAGQHYETLDRQRGGIELGEEAVRTFTVPGRRRPRGPRRPRQHQDDAQTL